MSFIFLNYAQISPSPAAQFSSYEFLAIILLFILFRINRNRSGRPFRKSRIYSLPIILLLINLSLIVDIPVQYYVYFAALLIVGILPGLRWGELSSLYYEDKRLMYKRSNIILYLWALSLFSRLFIEILLPGNLFFNVIVEGLLSFETGIIIGESQRLFSKYKALIEGSSLAGDSQIEKSD